MTRSPRYRAGLAALLFCTLGLFGGCYSFSPAAASAELDTYFVHTTQDRARNTPPNLSTRFTDDLQNKIRNESRLVPNDAEPDVEFKGAIVGYQVTSEAPEPGETTALNRLTITVEMDFINHVDETQDYRRNFSFFFDFPPNQDLSLVEDQAVTEIFAQITEDIFNASFNNW